MNGEYRVCAGTQGVYLRKFGLFGWFIPPVYSSATLYTSDLGDVGAPCLTDILNWLLYKQNRNIAGYYLLTVTGGGLMHTSNKSNQRYSMQYC